MVRANSFKQKKKNTCESNSFSNIDITKMNNKEHHTVGTIPTSNMKIIERDEIDIPSTNIDTRSLFWLATGTSIKSGGVKLVL